MRNTKMNKTKNASKRFDDLLPCEVKKIIYNGPAVIVEFKDGTKQVSKCMKSDIFDPEKGLMLCLLKHAYGEDIYHDFIQPIALSSGEPTLEEVVDGLTYLRVQKKAKFIRLQQELEFKERLDTFVNYIAYHFGGDLHAAFGDGLDIAFGDIKMATCKKLQQELEIKARFDTFEDYIAHRIGRNLDDIIKEAIYIAFGDDTDDETES